MQQEVNLYTIFIREVVDVGLAGAIVRNVTVSIFTLHTAKNINGNELENTVNWYLSNENLLAANSHLVDFIGQMELPNLYRRHQNKPHTSSDGQE